MNTPFFQFLLYILLVILTYFIVRNISKKVHESFDDHKLPPAVNISGKLIENNLHLYFLLPEVSYEATDVKVNVTTEQDKVIFYSIKELNMEKNVYHIVVENLPYDKKSKVYMQLKSKWGLGKISNLIEVTPKSEVPIEVPKPAPVNKPKKYVSCHPDGTYTIHKNFVINPPLINNFSSDVYEKLKKVLTPKEKTYEVEINLE